MDARSTSGIPVNRVVYQYVCQTLPVCHISEIRYGSSDTAVGNQFRIAFVQHQSPLPYPQTQGTGRGIAYLDRYLKRIEVWVGSRKIRAYALRYETSDATRLQRLKSVQEYGRDWAIGASDIYTGAAFPEHSFEYTNASVNFTVAGFPQYEQFAQIVELPVDFTGDGRADLLSVRLNDDGATYTIRIRVSGGRGFYDANLNISEGGNAFSCTFILELEHFRNKTIC